MVDDVTIQRLKEAFRDRLGKYPNEDCMVSFRMACNQLGINKRADRDTAWDRLQQREGSALIAEWSGRGRKHWQEAREDLNEEIHSAFNKNEPGAA